MIRINLLPHRELARAARRRQFNILLGIAAAAGVVIVVLGHIWIAAQQSAQEERNAFLTQEIAKLDIQIGEIQKIREHIQALIERKQVVEVLQSNRTEVVHLFDQMIRLSISGYTQSSARVSTLMRSLNDSPWFDSSTLIEIKAATVNNLRANQFILTVRQAREQPGSANDKGGKA